MKANCGCCHWNDYGKDVLKAAILAVVKNNPSHGYSLLSDLQELGFDISKYHPSVIYRILRNLEAEGLLESEWQTFKAGPARRVYKITQKGELFLKQWAENSKHYIVFLQKLVEFVQKGG
ncbi:PadR family transcriptional regulator [Pseudothermotoga thermarum]|uniref:Transcriptional regulator, PadR-like family n=1 Tax=Pseudothermotoga thermarum DSM 5069 TaxID=688269 RepID=F7YV37_9THEM|nr:PadR family transcriptional regulator [Pseudothermotoga thermarum]AEH50332.1 transcriptional regulator, PadR-like family [Pseudothermotoga thermarum DSM 5069]